MDTIAISKLKATCLERSKRACHVPVPRILPPQPPETTRSGSGVMAGTVTEIGDILAPLDKADWEVLR
jgi:hypothetical protein